MRQEDGIETYPQIYIYIYIYIYKMNNRQGPTIYQRDLDTTQ